MIAGGKLTTYRVMAKDAVDFAIGERAASLPSLTDRIPLAGAEGHAVLQRQAPQIAADLRLDHRDGRPPAAPVRRRC